MRRVVGSDSLSVQCYYVECRRSSQRSLVTRLRLTTHSTHRRSVSFVSAWTAATAAAAERRDVMRSVCRRLCRVSHCTVVCLSHNAKSPRLMEKLHCASLMSWLSCSLCWPSVSDVNEQLTTARQWAAARFWHPARGWPLDHQRLRRRLTSASTTSRSVHKLKTVHQVAVNQVRNPPSDNGDDPVGAPNKSARKKKNKKFREASQSPAEGDFLHDFLPNVFVRITVLLHFCAF